MSTAQMQRKAPGAHGVFAIALLIAWAVVIITQDGNSGPGFLVALMVGVLGVGTVMRLLDRHSWSVIDVLVAVGYATSFYALMSAVGRYPLTLGEWWDTTPYIRLLVAIGPISLALSLVRFIREPAGLPRTPPEPTPQERLGFAADALAATGANGAMGLDDRVVRIHHSGTRAGLGVGFGAGTKEIPLDQVTAIQWKDAGDMWVGFLEVSYMGGHERPGGLADATSSENAVTFAKAQQPAFEAIRQALSDRQAIRAAQQKGDVAKAEGEGVPLTSADIEAKLRSLADLRDKGFLSQQEYDERRHELLDRV